LKEKVLKLKEFNPDTMEVLGLSSFATIVQLSEKEQKEVITSMDAEDLQEFKEQKKQYYNE